MANKIRTAPRPKQTLRQRLSSKRIGLKFTPGKRGVAVRKTQYRLGGFKNKTTLKTKTKKDLWKAWSQYWKKEFSR